MTEYAYTAPIEFDGGSIEIDTTPDGAGDLEVVTRDGDHVAYLRPVDQIALRDLLDKVIQQRSKPVIVSSVLDPETGEPQPEHWLKRVYLDSKPKADQ